MLQKCVPKVDLKKKKESIAVYIKSYNSEQVRFFESMSLKDFAKKAIRALQPQGTARKPKTDATAENRPSMTLARIQAPLERAASEAEDAFVAPWAVVELWKQFQNTLAAPPPARAAEAAALRLEDFPD